MSLSDSHDNIELSYDNETEQYVSKYTALDVPISSVGETEQDALANLTDAVASYLSTEEEQIAFPEAVGVGSSHCPDCDGTLESNWDDYSWVCSDCGSEFEIEDVSLIYKKKSS
jgi:predicted RNase H-like HicB family nuclease